MRGRRGRQLEFALHHAGIRYMLFIFNGLYFFCYHGTKVVGRTGMCSAVLEELEGIASKGEESRSDHVLTMR